MGPREGVWVPQHTYVKVPKSPRRADPSEVCSMEVQHLQRVSYCPSILELLAFGTALPYGLGPCSKPHSAPVLGAGNGARFAQLNRFVILPLWAGPCGGGSGVMQCGRWAVSCCCVHQGCFRRAGGGGGGSRN